MCGKLRVLSGESSAVLAMVATIGGSRRSERQVADPLVVFHSEKFVDCVHWFQSAGEMEQEIPHCEFAVRSLFLFGYLPQQPFDEVVGRHFLGTGLKGNDDAMTHHCRS
jgi:hypothetical protein